MSSIMDTVQGLRGVLAPSLPKRQILVMLVVGFIIGLFTAYVIAPTVYYQTRPVSLEQSFQDEWVKLVADRQAISNSSGISADVVQLLAYVDDPVGIINALLADSSEAPHHDRLRALLPSAQQAQNVAARAPQPNILLDLLPFILGSILLVIIAGIAGIVWDLLLSPFVKPMLRQLTGKGPKVDATVQKEREARREAAKAAQEAKVDYTATFGKPIIQKMSIYTPGRQYDDSFSIEDEDEKFFGECGAGVSETIGSGSPEKIAAIEVWLFDKDDFVRTLTNVFASPHAFRDPATRAKLDPRGEQVVEVRPGATVSMETNALRMQARVVDVKFGTDPSLPPESYFEALTVEIVVWQKAAGAQPVAAAPAAPVPAATQPVAPAQPSFAPPPPPTYAPPVQQQPASPAFMPPRPPSAPAQPTYVPPRPPAAPPSAPQDDDPFGGTGDFNPIR
jgi:hypothetical protein